MATGTDIVIYAVVLSNIVFDIGLLGRCWIVARSLVLGSPIDRSVTYCTQSVSWCYS